jgi:hypothetical protein
MWLQDLHLLAHTLDGKHHKTDHECLRPPRIPDNYPKPDSVLTFGKLSSVFCRTSHEEDQPVPQLHDPSTVGVNLAVYGGPEGATARQSVCGSSQAKTDQGDCSHLELRTPRPATSRIHGRTFTG